MFATRAALIFRGLSSCRRLHLTKVNYEEGEHPLRRTFKILGGDLIRAKDKLLQRPTSKALDLFPTHVDILILGGGAMGTSIAYWLKEKSGSHGMSVVVIEKDTTVRMSII